MKNISITTVLSFLALIFMGGCAGPNPNIGERTTDMAWMGGYYKEAIETAKPHAENGNPWAQLRLGIMYENGWGVERSIHKAIEWYQKAAIQKSSGGWAEGEMIGVMGPIGYFNQNSDARIAQYKLANIYLTGVGGEKNLELAYLNIRTVVDESKGRNIFFCCEFAGGREFTFQEISKTYSAVLKQMTEEQKKKAEELYLKSRKPIEK